MSTTRAPERELLTIGAVCERLKSEFSDISISKIRYLEGEGLVTPKRTRGGWPRRRFRAEPRRSRRLRAPA